MTGRTGTSVKRLTSLGTATRLLPVDCGTCGPLRHTWPGMTVPGPWPRTWLRRGDRKCDMPTSPVSAWAGRSRRSKSGGRDVGGTSEARERNTATARGPRRSLRRRRTASHRPSPRTSCWRRRCCADRSGAARRSPWSWEPRAGSTSPWSSSVRQGTATAATWSGRPRRSGGMRLLGSTILVRNDAEEITRAVIRHRPLQGLLAFSAELGRLLDAGSRTARSTGRTIDRDGGGGLRAPVHVGRWPAMPRCVTRDGGRRWPHLRRAPTRPARWTAAEDAAVAGPTTSVGATPGVRIQSDAHTCRARDAMTGIYGRRRKQSLASLMP